MDKHNGLIEAIEAFQTTQKHQFHMPSHSGRYINSDFKGLLDQSNIQGFNRAARRAFNNVQGLEFIDGLIGDLGQLYHDAFSSKLTLYLQNGQTAGNHIVSLCLAGKNVLIQSNTHISVHSGLQLAGSKIYFVQPDYNQEYDIFLPIRPHQIAEILDENPEINAIYLTNPTIDGLCFDTQEIKNLIGDRLLIIDETHGAHFYFSDQCPQAALTSGADVSVTSVSTTLGGLQGTGLLNIGRQSKIDAGKIKSNYFMLGTTTPSPLLICDVEGTVKTFSQNGNNLINDAIKNAWRAKQTFNHIDSIKVFDQDGVQKDPIKLIIRVKGMGGQQLAKKLHDLNIQVEKVTRKAVLLTVHSLIQESEIEHFVAAMTEIANTYSGIDDESTPELAAQYQDPLINKILNKREIVMDIRDCFASETETIQLQGALGRISAEIKYKCPSGIPVLLYGEKIQENHILLFKEAKELIKVIQQLSE
ncbi:arginine decarboxylase [Stylonychia lemnae]|uniref:Arginine decarboxylase n=1 Tax=Stylonychia lemnae TaxID=5949 RepID=A0A078B941_STYLE|nr:arginine decarboxylase [Stylonychia lemnae]|eukprot:CDW90756.1 arginine decarboxylase [Stylonychia lemnae]